MNIDFDEIFDEIGTLPEFSGDKEDQLEISFPVLKEAGGKLYIVYMAHVSDDFEPDFYVLYDVYEKTAESMENEDVMELFEWDDLMADRDVLESKEFAEKPLMADEEEWDDDKIDEEFEKLEQMFAEVFTGETPDWQLYREYLRKLAEALPMDREYYLAFLPEEE